MNNTHTISSESLQITLSEQGAELISVVDNETQFQFMWQANPQIWARHAPVLFPIVGKLNQNKIGISGKDYSMSQHGFARDFRFEPIEVYSNVMRLMLESSPETKKHFPYDFKFFIEYELIQNTLKVSYSVLNTGDQKMYFSVGAHPGFNLPVANLNAYQIRFQQDENPQRYLLHEGLLTNETEALNLVNKMLPLNKELFQKDAIVLKSFKSDYLTLVQTDGKFEIHMACKGFPFMGIWTKDNCQEFICLEPWQGIADTVGFTGDISEKEGIVCAEPGAEISFDYSIRFTAP